MAYLFMTIASAAVHVSLNARSAVFQLVTASMLLIRKNALNAELVRMFVR